MIALIVIMPGMTPASLLAGLGIGAVAIGFAFQDIFENFLAGVGLRRHLIFDGSGRDPLNICGRVISRMRAHGYRVLFLVVLTSQQSVRH